LGFKPVESGTEENDGIPADAALLALCCGASLEQCNVYALGEPLAPVLAARREGVTVELGQLDAAFGTAAAHEFLIVEGVGGLRVEVCDGLDVTGLATRWGLPVLVVAANRLGVLSHTLLTVEALQAASVPLLGVVLNTISPEAPGLAERTNPQELARLLPSGVPLLGVCPFVTPEQRTQPPALAASLAEIATALFPGR
jgi:dethiobiotin synthetase